MLRQSPIVRSVPVAIHRPTAPVAWVAMRTRNSGLLQGDGMFWIVPENSASPCAFRGTLLVFAIFDEPGVFWVASTALHTRVPITSVIGPGVPLNCAPLMGKSLDFECSMSGRQVHASVAASHGPRKGPAVDIGHHVGNILLGDDADDVYQAHDHVVIGTRRGGGEGKRDRGSNRARSGNGLHLLLHRLPR